VKTSLRKLLLEERRKKKLNYYYPLNAMEENYVDL
jgi:hypothetical protein